MRTSNPGERPAETRILVPESLDPSDPAIVLAAEFIRQGELVAFPTETVYGLGGDATSPEAVELIYAAKNRPSDNPIIVHVGAPGDIELVAYVRDPRVFALLDRFWPGPLSVVLPAKPCVRGAACRGLDTVAVRMPAHPIALALIRAAGLPIAAPSANLSGRPSPTTAAHVLEDLAGRIPVILDGGACRVGIESTVLDLAGETPQILRPGEVRPEEISEVLGVRVILARGEALARSPGTRYRHYSPRASVVLLGEQVSVNARMSLILQLAANALPGVKIGLLAQEAVPGMVSVPKVLSRTYSGVAGLSRCYYACLRELDAAAVDVVFVEGVADAEPVMERVRRSSSMQVLTDAEARSDQVLRDILSLLSN